MDAIAGTTEAIAETDHSIIETCYHDGQVAVLKRARNPHDPRAVTRWQSEVEVLQCIGRHVSIESVTVQSTSACTVLMKIYIMDFTLEHTQPEHLSDNVQSTSPI